MNRFRTAPGLRHAQLLSVCGYRRSRTMAGSNRTFAALAVRHLGLVLSLRLVMIVWRVRDWMSVVRVV